MFGFFNHGLGRMANFEASYRAYPVSFIDKLDAEHGDKVFLPPSALDRLCEQCCVLCSSAFVQRRPVSCMLAVERLCIGCMIWRCHANLPDDPCPRRIAVIL